MSKTKVHTLITLLAMLVFLPGLGIIPLFDWDELNFAESAREMVISHNKLYVQLAFEPFWEKPPLFIWVQSFLLQLFGNHSWVFRLPNAIAGIVACNLAYHIGHHLGRRSLAVFWAITMGCTFAPLIYFKLGIIDPIFNLFIFLSLWHWYRITRCESEGTRPHWHYFLSGLFIGLAILTKGQVALIILGGVIFINTAMRGRWIDIFSGKFFIFLATILLVVGAWVLPLYIELGPTFFQKFIAYQIELFNGQIPWHNQPWFYHIVVLLFLCFPAAAFAIPFLFGRGEEDFVTESWHFFMRSLFWVVLILFSLVTTKIIHYSSLCWYPLTYFAAYQTYLIHTNRGINHFIQKLMILLCSFLLLIVLFGLPLVMGRDLTPTWAIPYLDKFAIGLLKQHRPWTWTALIPGMMMLICVMPYVFKNFLSNQHHPGKLLLGTAAVALSAYFCLLPPAAHLLQDELTQTIQSETKSSRLIETHGFKSYSLYYHANMLAEDFEGPWLKDTFVLNRTKFNPYPRQESKRIWIKDCNSAIKGRLITKCNYLTDNYFNYQFKAIDTIGAYWVWQRR